MKTKTKFLTKILLTLLSFCGFAGSAWSADTMLNENFQGEGMPAGWTTQVLPGGSDPTRLWSHYNEPYTEIKCVRLINAAARLVTPTLNVQGLSNVKLSFRESVSTYSTGTIDANLFVRYSTDGGSTWTLLAEFDRPPNQTNYYFNDTYKFEVPIPASTTPIKIAFDGYINVSTRYVLDDIIVTADLPASWPVVSVSTPAGTKLRESTRNSATWTFTRTGGDQSVALTVPYSLSGTATLGSDYTIDKPNSVTFAAGQATTTLTLTAKDDTVFNEVDDDQNNEFVALSLIGGQSGYKLGQVTGTMEVVDDDGKVSVKATDYTAREAGPQTGAWTFTRSADPTNELVVYYTLSGTATAGDYTLSSPSPITFPAGQSTVVLTLTPENDELREYDETMTLALSSNAKYQIGDQSVTTITILSDDPYDVNVLIIGTTMDRVTGSAFDMKKVSDELRNILNGANMGTVKVKFYDFGLSCPPLYTNPNDRNLNFGNMLLHEFYDPSSNRPPTARDYRADLRGELDTDWDYVILMEEPTVLERFPGFLAVAASEFGKEIVAGGAEPVLFMGWPAQNSGSSVDHYKESVYRVGRSLGYKVVPAGFAWQAQGSTYGTGHPTADGAYLAAASIYSRIWGVEGGQNTSASISTYNPKPALATVAHNTVVANKGKVQYSGKFVAPRGVWNQMGDTRREWAHEVGMNSSAENNAQNDCTRLAQDAGMDLMGEFGYGPRPGLYIDRDPGRTSDRNLMSVQLSSPTPLGDEDGFYEANRVGLEVRDADYASSILLGYSGYRHTPDSLMFAMVNRYFPDVLPVEGQHAGRIPNITQSAFWRLIMSGRYEIDLRNSPDSLNYVCQKTGYETAWRLSTLQGRAPGFKVMPSHWTRHRVDPVTPELMTVRFINPPKSEVTVNVTVDQTWAEVSPQVLTFNAQNYDTPQTVTVSLKPEAANYRASLFNVSYTTSSDDEVYDDLSDSWEYGVNTLPIPQDASATTTPGQAIDIALLAEDPDIKSRITYKKNYVPKQVMTFALADGSVPQNGTVAFNGDTVTYTPNPGFIGFDSFQCKVNDGLADSTEISTVTINVLADGPYDFNLIINPGAQFIMDGWTGQFYSSIINAATDARVFKANNQSYSEAYQDVDISHYSAAINAGLQSFRLTGMVVTNGDEGNLGLEFRDANGNVLGTPYNSNTIITSTWTEIKAILQAPAGAVIARVILKGRNKSAGDNDVKFDDLSLVSIKPANTAPVAVDPSVAYVAQNVPTVIPLQATDADRLPADKLSFEIVAGGGPRNGSITGWKNGLPIYTPNANYLGNDSFQFRVYDGTAWSANVGVAQIVVRVNQAPTITVHTPVMPESNEIFMVPVVGLIFETTITDDGGPADGELTIQWQQLEGPVQAVFENPNSANTACSWPAAAGTFRFAVTASDGTLSTTKEFTVTLGGYVDVDYNVAVQIDVGLYEPVAAGEWLQLQGDDYTDDGKPLVPGYNITEWSKLSGPGNVTFTAPERYDSKVKFDYPGTYVLRLTADDGQIKSYADLTITVTGGVPANTLTVVGGRATTGNYQPTGTVVPIVADSPEDGYRFVNWTTSDGGTIADATAASTTYTMPAGNATLTANFVLNNAPVISLSTATDTLELATGDAPFKPSLFPTILWADSSDPNSIIHFDGAVSQLKDKSGNDRHLTQSNINYQPKTGIRKLLGSTGLNVLDCDGNDWMNVAGVPLPSSGNLAVFAVAGIDVVNNEGDSIFSFNDTNDFQLEAGISSNFRGRINAYGIGGTAVSSANNNLGPSIYNTVFDKTGAGKYTFFVDGTAKSTAQNYTTALSTTQDVIAFANRTKNQSPDGFFGEMLVVEDVSLDTRQKIEGYLAYKWNLVDKLPDGHPYEVNAPTTSAVVAIANITGTVDDSLDGDSFTTEWIVRSAPQGAIVDFANNDRTAINTTVYFYTPGTYVLRFVATENVPYGVSSYQELTFTVGEEGVPNYTVNYSGGTHGAILGQSSQLVAEGNDTSSVTVVPDSGYIFTGWSDGSVDNPRTDTNITSNLSVTALYAVNQAPTAYAGADREVQLLAQEPIQWTPDRVPGLVLQLDAADTSTIIADAEGRVQRWDDKRKNGLSLNQGTPALQPITGATWSEGSSLNAINFTGSKMASASNPFGASIKDAFVMVVHKVDATTNGILFSLTGSNNGVNRWQVGAPNGGNLMFDCGGGATPYRVSKSYGVAAGGTAMIGFYGSTTDNVQQVYKDGVLFASDTSGHEIPTVGNILLGGDNGSTLYQNTTIGEVLIINGTVDLDTRRKLEGYLAHKWGIALPSGHLYKDDAPTVDNYLASLSLNGSVNDGNGTTPTATWSVVSTQPAGLPVEFANSSSPGTTASFTALGTYTLRLTADDGVAAPVSDDVVITVVDTPVDSAMSSWLAGYNLGLKNGPNDDADDDRKSNMMEFAFGTDPSQMDMGPLSTDGSKRGDPVAAKEQGGGFALYYIRRTDHGSTGSVIYSTHFSDDLSTFEPSSVGLEVVGTAGAGYELVKVPFPSGARFGYVKIEPAP